MANLDIKLSKEQQQYLVFAVLIIGGGGFSYIKYFWMPTSAKISETREQIVQVERKIDKAKRQAGKLNKIKKEIALLNQQAAEAEKQLPKDQDLVGVIELVTGLTEKYNFDLTNLAQTRRTPRPHFIEIGYTVGGKATYHDLGRFLAALALEERIFNVQGVSFGPPDAAGVMVVNFELISYQYKG